MIIFIQLRHLLIIRYELNHLSPVSYGSSQCLCSLGSLGWSVLASAGPDSEADDRLFAIVAYLVTRPTYLTSFRRLLSSCIHSVAGTQEGNREHVDFLRQAWKRHTPAGH